MNTSSENKIETPNIIQALVAGFNTIASKPYLMLLPILLDIFLWFGPSWRVDMLFRPFIQSFSQFPGLQNSEYAVSLKNYQEIWQEIINNFNLAVSLRTIPIGVPSLMTSKSPFQNPLGQTFQINLETSSQFLGMWFLFLIVGFLIASLYYENISNHVIPTAQNHTLSSFLRTFSQIILMPLLLLLILLLLLVPVLFIFSLIAMISPTISQFLMIFAGVAILWILIPLVFTPHGIFLYKQNLIAAMMTSISVVKVSMGKTSWFILIGFVLIEGMNYLWRMPPVDNWFLMVGILGHAFIVSAVIASSFYYFIDATKFAQTVMTKPNQPV